MKNGSPAKTWGLDCPPCERYLNGGYKDKIIRTIPGDKDRGIPSRLEHIPDTDPHWSSTPEAAPLTPDEQHVHKLRAEQGREQLDTLSAYAAILQSGVSVPEQAQWLVQRTLEEIAKPVIKGSVVCANGHDNRAGMKFCGECGLNMETRGSIAPAEEIYHEKQLPLSSLHVATLKKMARQQNLSDKGTKADLIGRLS